MGRRRRLHEVGEDGMKVEVAEERGVGGIGIHPFYGPKPLGMRPRPFTTILTCDYLIPRPRIERRLQK